MGRRYSITGDPEFRRIAFVIGLLLFCTIYYNFKTGGIVNGIISGLEGLYNIGYVTILIGFFVIIVFKWRIISAFLINNWKKITEWILSWSIHKNR